MSLITKDYLPAIAAMLLLWLERFISVANANLANTGLTAGQVNDLNALYTEFQIAYGNHLATHVVAKGATDTKNQAMAAVAAEARKLAQIVQKHPGATNALKLELGLNAPPAPNVPVEPQLPTLLTATLSEIGWVTLKWDRNGNKQGTTFIIESREGTTGPFTILAAVTRSKFVDKGRTPGVRIEYRVKATRSGRETGYTPTATIYAEGWQGGTLHLAA